MNIDVEKKKINDELKDATFVADFQRFLDDITFDGETQNLYLLERGDTLTPDEVERQCTENTRRAHQTLSQLVADFYQKYGTDYADEREFLFVLKETLRINLKSKIASAKIAAAAEQPVVVSADIEEKRAELLSYFEDNPIDDPQFMDQYLIRKEIETCEPEKLQKFLDSLKVQKQEKIAELEADVKSLTEFLERGEFEWTNQKFTAERRLEDAKRFLNYYKVANDLEVFIPLCYRSSVERGNSLISKHISKNIEVSRFDNEVKVLQVMTNLLESYDRGLIAENVCFDGSRIVSKRTGRKWHLDEIDIRNFVAQVPNFSREQQANFIYDQSTIEHLMETTKKPQAGFSRTNPDGSIDKFIVYSEGTVPLHPERTLAPLFVKHIQEDPAKNTFSVMMYVFEEPDLKFGTQIFRIDKVPPVARWGVASHKQTSGDVIETNVHVHGYDIFDRVLINTNKPMELGHSDISNNFITQAQLDNRVLEMFVSQKFNISRDLSQDLIQDISQGAPANQPS